MSDEDRAAREEKVLKAVREWLPELEPGMVIHVTALDPSLPRSNGALFDVRQTRTFACSRGSR